VAIKFLVVPLCSDSKPLAEVSRCVESYTHQDCYPFDWDLKIVCNTNNAGYYEMIHEAFSEFEVLRTLSNGGNGMGHNSVLDLFKRIYKQNGYTHLIMIDADDIAYPCAFEAIDELLTVAPDVDYMSNMQCSDSVRYHRRPIQSHQQQLQLDRFTWLHSDFNLRRPVSPYLYWDGETCNGGEVTLFVSARAVECGLEHMEIPNIPDDFMHMLRAVKAHVEGKLLFCNTDTNDVYCYIKTNPNGTTNQPDFTFDPKLWPPAERELLTGPTFECLRGFTRQQLPWVTIPQIMMADEKTEFIRPRLLTFP
jgi:hypothetical protein